MKIVYSLLLPAGLASAALNIGGGGGGFRNINLLRGGNNLNNISAILNNSTNGLLGGANLGNLNLGGLNLGDLDIDGLNLGSVDLADQDAIARAILQMLNGLCLSGNNALNNLDSVLGLGFDDDLDLFLQLAQLAQLQQLGSLGNGGVRNLFNSGFVGGVGGGFNLGEYILRNIVLLLLNYLGANMTITGVFKREVTEARKTMKRTKLRRGTKIRRQCAFETSSEEAAANSSAAAAQQEEKEESDD